MKQTQFYIAVALAAVCLVLSIALIAVGQSSQSAQLDFQKRQNEIQIEMQQRQAEVNKGAMSDQVGGAILRDLAPIALQNPKIKDVLAKHGFNVGPAASPSATGTGAASTTPATSSQP